MKCRKAWLSFLFWFIWSKQDRKPKNKPMKAADLSFSQQQKMHFQKLNCNESILGTRSKLCHARNSKELVRT